MDLKTVEKQCCSTAKFLQSRFKTLSDRCFDILSVVQGLDYENDPEDADFLKDVAGRLLEVYDLQDEIVQYLGGIE